jgi:hypothetical protein
MTMLNKHLTNIIQEYLEIKQPFLEEYNKKTWSLLFQLNSFMYYDKYIINQYDYQSVERWTVNEHDRRYHPYNIKITHTKWRLMWGISRK